MKEKKFSLGAVLACLAAICSLISLFIYLKNVQGAGYFQGASVKNLVLYTVVAAVLFVLAILIGKSIGAEGGKAQKILASLCQVAAPVLLAFCLINLISARVEGLGFIYFSNADVLLEVQTPENLSSATWAIASMVCFGVSMLLAVIGAFANPWRKQA